MKINHNSDHTKRRAEEYPSLQDQLDMLWHGMNNGTMEKVEPFYSSIKAVKDKYPRTVTEEQ
jgi:hypothetical protein